jgi:hypothetical protein
MAVDKKGLIAYDDDDGYDKVTGFSWLEMQFLILVSGHEPSRSINAGNSLTRCEIINFSRKIVVMCQ